MSKGFFDSLSKSPPKSLALAVAAAALLFFLKFHMEQFKGAANSIAESFVVALYLVALIFSFRVAKAGRTAAKSDAQAGRKFLDQIYALAGLFLFIVLGFLICVELSFAFFGWLG